MWNTVLFDLDGTLTDSGEGITKCVQFALRKEFGIKVENLHELDSFVGPPLKEQFMQYASLTEEEAERAITAYRERYRTRGIYENRVYDGIPEVLAALAKEGMVLALTSSKPTEFCREILRYFGIEQYFRVILGSEMDGRRSRKADVIEEALRILGMSGRRDEVVLVGDRKYDVQGAKACGIGSIGVTFGYGSRKELEECWPDCIVDNTTELRNVLIGQARDEKNRGADQAALQPGPGNWGASNPWTGYYGAPQGYYFPPQGYGVPQGTQPPQGYYVPQPYPLPGYNYPPQGHYLQGSEPNAYDRNVRNYDPQSVGTLPVYGELSGARPGGPVKKESVLYCLWRVISPLLLDVAISVVITNLALLFFMLVYGNSGFMSRAYTSHGMLIMGISDAFCVFIFALMYRADLTKRVSDGIAERIFKVNTVNVGHVLLVIVFAVSACAVIALVTSYLPIGKSDMYSELENQIESSSPLLQVAVVCVLGPISEELLYRGLVFRRLRDFLGCGWAALIAGVIFGFAHGNLYQGVYAAIFGIVLALLYEHYGTIWMTILAHVANNMVATFVDPLFDRVGSAGQLVYSIVCVVLAVLIGWYLFYYHRKVNSV